MSKEGIQKEISQLLYSCDVIEGQLLASNLKANEVKINGNELFVELENEGTYDLGLIKRTTEMLLDELQSNYLSNLKDISRIRVLAKEVLEELEYNP